MPQVHNRAMMNDGFGKGSIAHRAADFSITSRRVQAMGEMEKKSMSLKIKLISKNAQTQQNRWAKAERRLKESLKRTIAYGRVTREHNISKLMGGPRYKSALNRNYTYKSLRFDIIKMLNTMEPEHLRQEDSKKKIDIARDQVKGIIERNLASMTTPRTNRREEARIAQEKKEAELRAQRMKPFYWLPRKTPLPPIENSLLGGGVIDAPSESKASHRTYEVVMPVVKQRELTLIETRGVTGKPHFQRPGQSREKDPNEGREKAGLEVEQEINKEDDDKKDVDVEVVAKGIEEMNVRNQSGDQIDQLNNQNDQPDRNENRNQEESTVLT